jgi:hypothetical protein
MQTVAPGWELEVQPGPGWLFVRLRLPAPKTTQPTPVLADHLWSLMESYLVDRLAVELDEVEVLDRRLLAQLVQLHRRIRQHGGVLRLCGLSPQHQATLKRQGLCDRLPAYDDFEDAVMGSSPCHKPR